MGGTARPTGQVDGAPTDSAKPSGNHMGGDWAVSGSEIGRLRATAGTQLPLELDRS